MTRDKLSCGRDFFSVTDINKCIEEINQQRYDFTCLPIFNPLYEREFVLSKAKQRPGPATRSDRLLSSSDWRSVVVAKLSPWIDVDSKDECTRKNSEQALRQELAFASHLGVPAILIRLRSPRITNLARILNEHIPGHNHQYWIEVPMTSADDDVDDVFNNSEDDNNELKHDTWQWWNQFRTLCESNKSISVALELSANLPPPDVIDRWLGETLKGVVIPTDVFLTNKKGFPVLSKAHQALVRDHFMKMDLQFVLRGSNRTGGKSGGVYYQYLDHLWNSRPLLDEVARFAKGYEDYLQSPLQPLMDNLDSGTYEIFEEDPIKYREYEQAVYRALLDREAKEQPIILMVLGAGRGPLVKASLRAAAHAKRRLKVYAVEKNPNAVVTLENLKEEEWGDQVTVVSSDMRAFDPPEKADIIVSELLGSFGDNELSPECLDGATKFLKDDAISIPCSYTSFLAPMSSAKLWNESSLCKEPAKPPEAPWETPYVVRLHNVNVFCKPQSLFTFSHPNRAEFVDNTRYEERTFHVPMETVLHGFAGYFTAQLYKDVQLSILPETHSEGMFSWFPIFFPIRQPLLLHAGDVLDVHFWRMNNGKNVWYEWAVTSPAPQAIHNPKGRSYTIGL